MLFSDGAPRTAPRCRTHKSCLGRSTWTGQVSNWVTLEGIRPTTRGHRSERGQRHLKAGRPSSRRRWTRSPRTARGVDLAKAEGRPPTATATAMPDRMDNHRPLRHRAAGKKGRAAARSAATRLVACSYANFNQVEGPGAASGGYQMPGADLWAGDHGPEAENGSVGCVRTQFGHDLGLRTCTTRSRATTAPATRTLMARVRGVVPRR